MMCYRDVTFCPHYKECADGFKCHRALTPSIIEDAERVGLPISQFIEKPAECYKEKTK